MERSAREIVLDIASEQLRLPRETLTEEIELGDNLDAIVGSAIARMCRSLWMETLNRQTTLGELIAALEGHKLERKPH